LSLHHYTAASFFFLAGDVRFFGTITLPSCWHFENCAIDGLKFIGGFGYELTESITGKVESVEPYGQAHVLGVQAGSQVNMEAREL
jgi:hypothetical protein